MKFIKVQEVYYTQNSEYKLTDSTTYLNLDSVFAFSPTDIKGFKTPVYSIQSRTGRILALCQHFDNVIVYGDKA